MKKVININKAACEEIIKKYTNKDLKCICREKQLDTRGIDYNNWLKLNYKTIQEGLISNIGRDAWYLLWHLLAHSRNKEFIQTTCKIIERNSTLKITDIKKSIISLLEHSIIYIPNINSNFSANDVLDIVILYHNNELYPSDVGYKPVPVDFVKRILYNIDPEEFAVYCILFCYFRYFITGNYVNRDTGEIEYYWHEVEHAFPGQQKIADLIGYNDYHPIHNIVKRLSSLGLISYTSPRKKQQVIYDTKNDEYKIDNPRYWYRVKLLQRSEYIYNYIVNEIIPDNRSSEHKQMIAERGFIAIARSEHQHILRDKDYINFAYSSNINYFTKALQIKDYDWYNNKIYSAMPIDNYDNTDIIKYTIQKREECQ